MSRDLRILYLAPCAPTGRPFGLRLRTAAVARALKALGDLDCVVVQVSGDGFTANSPANQEFGLKRYIEPVPIGSRSWASRWRCAFDARFTDYYGHTTTAADRASVLASLPNYDLVWVHHLHTANYLGQWEWTRTVLDLDDIPSTYYRTLCEQGGWAAQLRARVRMQIARRRERLLRERFPVLAVCSEADRDYLGGEPRAHVIPNGFNRPEGEPVRRLAQPPRIGFIGKFGYLPNDEGIRWFLGECWPQVQAAVPEARMRIVGQGGEAVVPAGSRNVDVLGWVDDAADEIATWSLMVVPLRMGSGTRLKIAEGFSRKCPLVSTTFGAHGYGTMNGRELLLADSAADFAAACLQVLRDPAAAAAMAERAWRVFLDKWTWEAIRPRIHVAAEAALRR